MNFEKPISTAVEQPTPYVREQSDTDLRIFALEQAVRLYRNMPSADAIGLARKIYKFLKEG